MYWILSAREAVSGIVRWDIEWRVHMRHAAGEKSVFEKFCSAVWWIVLLRGIFAVVLGVLLVTRPQATLMVMLMFLGAYWLIDGIFTLVGAVRGRRSYPNWGWSIFTGIMSMLAGLIIFGRPLAATLFTEVLVIYIIAAIALFFGISGIITGIRLRKDIGNEWSMVLSGVLATLLGILLLISPVFTATILIVTIGILAILFGIGIIVLAFRIRSVCVPRGFML
jgi:uncharacterized membrane protein HdeD (DUF308 family)